MADGGSEITVGEALIALTAEVHRVHGRLDGLVTHERIADLITDMRREYEASARRDAAAARKYSDDIEARLRALIKDEHFAISGEIIQISETKVKTTLADERQIEKHTMRRVRMFAMTGGGIGAAGGIGTAAYALFQGFGGG